MKTNFTRTSSSMVQVKMRAIMLLLFVLLVSFTGNAQLAIQSFSSTYTAASNGSSYNANGAQNSSFESDNFTYKFGTNSGVTDNILNFSSFSIGANTYAYRNIPTAFVKIRRNNNPLVSGVRNLLWYQGATSADVSDPLRCRQSYQESMEIMFNGARGLNAGTDNIFNNSADGNGNNNNIERFDYIIPGGYTVVANSQEGFIVMDRGVLGAHDPFCVSVIRSLDGSQNPATYTSVLWLNSSHYGTVNPIPVMYSYVLRKDPSDSKLEVSAYTNSDQGVGGVFIRYSDLGLANGTVIYGYSVFGADFPSGASGSKVVDFTNTTYFPNNTTPSNGGLDMLAVSGVFQLSNALAPIANDVTGAHVCNLSGTGQISVPALSAIDLNSGGSISNYKILSLPPAGQGVLYYHNGSSYVPASVGLLLTISQSASLKFDPADGFSGEAVFEYLAINNFGLLSNIAYGTMNFSTLPVVSAGPNQSICIGSTTVLNATGATTYTWSPSTGLSCTTCASPTTSTTTTRTYTITGSNPGSGCVSTGTITVSVNPLPTVSAGSGTSICIGSSTTLNATGGVTYSWTPATGLSCTTCASPVASHTTMVTYTVTGTNANGCSAKATVTVSVNPSPAAISGASAVCAGQTTTYTDATSGGTWSSSHTGVATVGAATGIVSGVAAGTSLISYTLPTGCSATKVITVNALPTISGGSGVGICVGGSTSLSATGGTSYSWSPAIGLSCTNCANPTASPSTTRTYTVTGFNASGCVNTATVTVSVNSLPAVSAGANVAICIGSSTVLNATGATTYSWSPATGLSCTTCASPTANPTTNRTYTVTGTSGGCVNTATVAVSVNPLPTISAGSNVTICNGSSTGLSATGGTSYTWTPATALSCTACANPTANPTSTITYTVTGTNANGCVNTATVMVSVNPLAATITGTASVCAGLSTTLSCSTSGGTWSSTNTGVATIGSATGLVSGLTAGTTTISYILPTGCFTTRVVTVNPAVTASAISTNVNCNGGSNGTIDLTPVGGTTPYTYLWNGGVTTQDRTGLAAGAYSVTVTDANGCTTTTSKTITQPATLTASATSTNVNCNGGANGTIDLTVAGGTTAYSYSWSNGATTQDLSGLSAGSYSVTVTDANGCSTTASRTITQPTVLTATTASANALCSGCNNGTAGVTPAGGTPAYTYLWSNGATTQNVTGLVAGNYSVTVTDANGCIIVKTITITQPSVFAATVTGTNVNCFGGNNGTADLTVSGGTTPYTYVWSNGATTQDLTSLTAGTYSVVITDANGYTLNRSVTITQPTVLAASATNTNVSCNGGSNGSIDVTVTGGTTAYTYLWNGGATTQDRTGLAAGTYSVVVTDANGCTTSVSKTITQPTTLTASATNTNVNCNGGSNGTIDLTPAGGTTPYTYLWNGGVTTQDRTGLAAGTYSVTVTDANGCTTTTSKTITQPATLTASATSTNVNCNGGANGTIDLTVAGGTTAYSYSWSNGATTQDLSGLSAGTYSVTVTDANGCSTTASRTITQPTVLTATTAFTNALCSGCNNGTAGVTPAGGTPAYTYLWSNGATTQNVTGLVAGNYSVTVTDANGCAVVKTITITQPSVFAATVTGTNVNCFGGNNGTADLTVSGGTTPYTYLWSNGATTQDLTGLTAGTYSVVITDANGYTLNKSVTITQPTVLAASATNTNVSCNGGSNGSIDVTVTGGTTAYTYLWNGGATTQDRTGLPAGTYSVLVTDANGCTTSVSKTITQPTTLTASATNTNVNCNGGSNGTIDLTPAGGTTPYTYLWNGGVTTQDRTGLAAGTYSVTVTDANGCTTTTSRTITQPATLTASATSTNVNCNGGANGTIDLTVAGGTTAYSYVWSNGATTQDLSGLSAGTYSVTVTDANGCSTTASRTITQPTVLTATTASTNALCSGCNNGTAGVTPAGGTPSYTYLWSNGATTQNVTGLVAGNYSVTVTDANGCVIVKTITITQPSVFAATITGTNVNCFGGNNGTADLTVSGGTTPYTYLWSNGATTQDLTSLTAGTYSVVITDANGYTLNRSVTITQPTVLAASATNTNVSCNGGSNGSIDVTVTGGTTAYTYLWNGGVTTQDRTGLAAGTYSVVVTDANGCTTSVSKTITQPTTLTASATNTNVNCNGGSNGTIDLTPAGGTTPYTYLWNGGVTTQDRTGLAAGTYSVTVTDANGCTTTTSRTITQPATLTASATSTNVNCNGGANGTIDLTVAGGTTAYSYVWSNGATTQDLSGLSAGTYSVTVTDANGCSTTASRTITQPTVLTATTASTNALCNGCNNGTAGVTPAGGTPAYTYLWSNGATTQNVTGLVAGNYSVTVTDANGCIVVKTITITQPSVFAATVTGTNVNCFGGNNGTADLTVSGGTTPYTYLWSNGATTQDLTSLTAGTYSVVITDANGYTLNRSVTITQPTVLAASATNTNVSCNGGSNGSIDVTVTGGTTAYTYLWNGGATTQDRTGLAAGTYSVVVTDANGCTTSVSKTITQPTTLTASATNTNVNCNGGSNGTIDLTPAGGTTPYTYLWNGGVTTQDRTGLAAGTYSVTVIDANGCTTTTSRTITQPATLTASATSTNVNCNGGANGTIDLTVAGGTTAYSYVWSNGATTQDLSGLSAGTYSVTVTDANGCSTTASRTITQPTVLTATTASTNALCSGCNNGTAGVTPAGGTPAYTYLWSNGATTQNVTGLVAGNYSVTVTDANGCIVVKTITITQPSVFAATVTGTNVNCFGGNNGTTDLTVSGGTTPYTYLWSNGATTQDLTSLTAGTYSVVITDANGYTLNKSVTITQPTVLAASATNTNVSCFGGSNGSIDVTVTGGTTAYTYLWNGGVTTQDRTGLAAGTYSVVVTDANGCTTSVSKTITQPTTLTASATNTNVNCNGGSNGTIDLTPAGGITPYTYLWNGGVTTQDRTGLAAGTYSVTVTDANGCTTTTSRTITQPATLTASATSTNVNCNAGANGTIDLTVAGGTTAYSYSWSNGATTQDLSGLSAGTYSVTVTDANGCSTTASRTITQPTVLTATTASTNALCNGCNNGTAGVTPAGGTPAYTYLWSNGATTQNVTGLVAGNYSVTVTDANGCIVVKTITITQPSVFAATVTGTNVNCNGGANGTADLTVSGGTTPYTYLWSNGATTQDLTGLTAGTYSVVITDANGYTLNKSITVTQPATLAATGTSVNVSCYGLSNGSVDVTVTGGTTAYSYSWSNGATTQDITGLAAGTYSVLVTDANGCTTTVTKTITQPATLTATASSTNALCYGCNNGTASLVVSGGTTAYTYLWSNGATTQNVTGLVAGTYSVTITDANGCNTIKTVVITQPAVFTATVTGTNVNCNGGANGTADLTVSGGTTPYTYLWSNGATTQDLTGLTAGTYSVVVTDANGYTINQSITVTQPATLAATGTSVNVSCFGLSNGSVDVTVTGGTTAYNYSWSNGATTQDITGLAAGTYSVLVTDANGCTTTVTKTITQPATLTATASSTNALCYGCNNGTASLVVSGGTTAYTYLWSNGATSQNVTGLVAGTYSVTITDANGCTTIKTVVITQPAVFTATVTGTNVNCNGGANGTADLTVSGGTTPYTYLWSNGATTQDLSGLTAGTYSVVVTDANGYTINQSITVTEPATLAASGTSVNVSCYGLSNGSVDVTVTGGTTAYNYSWSNGATTQDITGLAAGTYSVLVTDANGCTATVTKTITQPATLTATASSTNALCYGCNNGTASLVVSGGTTAYTYLWSNGATTQNLTGLVAGTYSVTITDANGCTTVEEVIITQPSVFAATVTGTNVNCNGGNNGTADLTVTGGTTPYTYLWSNGATTQDLSGLAAGTYSVVVTDANGYTINQSITVTQPATLAATGTSVNVSCFGLSNGSVDVTVTGGTIAYSYSWSNGATTQDITGLAAGTYSVLVTDANGCTSTVTKTITQPATLTATASSTNALCYGCNNGTASLVVSGGTTAYTYLWSNGATTQNVTGLVAGTYSVTITDANGCTTVKTVVITQPAVFTATVTGTNVNCNGGSNGTADLTVSGGTTPYTYLWSNGATTQDLTGLTAGTYSVVVTDANGYTINQSITVTQPATLAAIGTSVNVSCYGLSNGSVDVTVTGGTTAYNYSWSNGATTQDITGLAAGTYSVLVTDANGCTATVTKTITQPATLTATASSTNALCYGCNNGTASLVVSGGTTAYTYLWSNGATTQNVTGLVAGTYSVTITDANGCTTIKTVVITQPAVFTATVTGTNVNCNGGSNGTADLTVSGGTTPYTYLWSNGATTQDLSGLTAGTYSVVITDANGYTLNKSITVTQPATLAATGTSVNVSCFGLSNGSVDVTVTGGTTAYSYSWSNGATTQDITGLAAGTYSVLVTDANGCTATVTKTITQPATLTATASSTNALCYGCNNGTASLVVSGGTTAYTYLWSNGATTQNLTGLVAGTYSVTITDANGCTTIKTVVITQPAVFTATVTGTNVNCNGGSNGTADLTVSGGTTPYTYLWSNGATTQDLTGLTAGTYSVVVTDANGYTINQSITVTQLATLAATGTSVNVSCFGLSNGSVDVTVTGGTTAYNYSWSNGSTTQDITGLAAGTYSVLVTDANGCTATVTKTITQPATLTATASSTNALCYGCNNGTASLVVSGGTTAYTYLWSNGATTQNVTGLVAGNYSVTITDANGCTTIETVVITQPAVFTATVTGTNVNCNGGSNGTADLTVGGGTTPYTYLWSNGATTQDLTGLTAGTYSVVITDANGYTLNKSITVTQPATLAATGTSVNVSCYGLSNGSVDVTVTGGTTAYGYSWSNGATTQDITGLAAGTYSVLVTDANGCTTTVTKTITQPATLTATASSTNALCYGCNNGTASLVVSGGTTAYTYLWSNGATTQNVTGLVAGTYSVTITDANGCTTIKTVVITQPAVFTATVTGTNVNCNGGSNGTADLTVSGGTTPYTYLWSNGATTQDLTGLTAGTYSVVITDANGYTLNKSITVTQPATLAATGTSVNVSCFGLSNGSVDVTVTGGSTAYNYSWSNGATTQDITGLAAGTYSVLVTDANGCTSTVTKTITQPATLTATASSTNALCYGCNNGTASLVVSGGTTAYTYLWSNGATAQNVTGLVAGTYSVTITDANGCTTIKTVVITQPAVFTATVTGTNVNCNGGSNGTADLTVSGGTTPYTYLWSNGATTQDLTGLTAGTYSVVVTDANGYTLNRSVTITQPTVLVAVGTSSNVNCHGGSNGTVYLSVSGGTAAYTYLWSNGATTQNISGLTAGTYSVLVTDANGCTATVTKTITQPAPLAESCIGTNIGCFGAATGAINVTISGGVAPYTYNWSNGATSEDLTGLTAGTYSVMVTDAHGCTISRSYTITSPSAVVVTSAVTNVNCNGGNTGAIDLTVSGGTAPYTYNWSNGATTQDLTGRTAGTYSVTVRDGLFCNSVHTFTITQPAAITVTAANTNVSCNGGNNGAINITVAGGVAPYTYIWSNGAVCEDLTGITAGTYSVTVRDANGCTRTMSYTITQPSVIAVTTALTHVSCFGGNNGVVNITVTGGVAPYTYVWNTGATTQDLYGRTAGTYSVVITDANGCTANRTYTIIQPAIINVTNVNTNVSCNGGTNGAINITVTGGVAPYSYSWSNGATTQDVTGLCAGTYSVTVVDFKGCIKTRTYTITQPSVIAVTNTINNVSCFAGTNGAINITVTGGVAPYTYVWSTGATTQDLYGRAAGTYSVNITDANGCITSRVYTITQPAIIDVTNVNTNVTCNGGANGAINITVTGGVAPYTYSWSNGATTQDVSGLTAGCYTVTVVDFKGCTKTRNFTITQPAPIVLTGTTNTVVCGCLHGMGEIYLDVTGGTAPYTFLWSNGATSQNDTGLWTGTYSVVVTDGNGCTATGSYSVISPVAMSIYSSVGNATCNGASDGTIAVAVTGGIAPYTYSWSTGATTSSVSGLAAGVYSVAITDANGCTRPEVFTVTEPAPIVLTGTTNTVVCGCVHGMGEIYLDVTGGTEPYTFLWSNGATSQNDTGLWTGTYSVVVTDGNGCTATGSYSVISPVAMSIYSSVGNATCNGASDGTIAVAVTGGIAPYTYSWSTGATTSSVSGLAAGVYSVAVTDANGCTRPEVFTVTEPAPIVLTGTTNTVVCGCLHGMGEIYLDVTGGTEPYTFLWSNGATSQNDTGLWTGTYSVVVTDGNGCTATGSYSVISPVAMSIYNSVTNVSCSGANDGTIAVAVTGGIAPYTYSWSTGATTSSVSGLAAGVYSVAVTDANGCTRPEVFTVTEPDALVLTGTHTNVTTCSGSNGAINITIAGGSAPYTYNWSNGATCEDLTGLTAGVYSVTVTDANGCSVNASYTITEPGVTTVAIEGSSAPVCVGSVISLAGTPTGGAWTSGNTSVATVSGSGLVFGVNAGTAIVSYSVTNTCGTFHATRIVSVNGTPSAGTISGPTNVCVGSVILLTSTVPGGEWSNGTPLIAVTCPCNSGQLTGIAPGVATVSYTVTNECGVGHATYQVTVNAVPTISSSLITPVIAGAGTASMTFTTTGSPTQYSIVWGTDATAAGFVNVTAATLATSPLSIAVPATATDGTYTGTIAVSNGYCTGVPQPFSITVNPSVNIYTYAGTGTMGYTGNNGAATLANMSHPYNIGTDCNGNTYIADFENAVVRKVSATGVITTVAGNGVIGYSGDGGPATAATMSHPNGVALDAAGNLYFSDYNNHAVRKVSTSGVITRVAGNGGNGYAGDGGQATAAKLYYPAGLTIDGYGNLYIADNANSVIRKVTPTGIISTVAGTNIPGYTGDGGAATAARINAPKGVHADGAGNLYITDLGTQVVRKVDAAGIITTIAGNGIAGYSGDGGAATAARLNNPVGITTDASGNVYFTEQSNYLVRKINTSGIISTIAGNHTHGYSGDGGPALLAQLNQPMGLSRDCSGRIYIADNANYAIRILGEYNRTPYFPAGATQSVEVCTGATSIPMNTRLSVIDYDTTQPMTWTVVSAPAHGTLVAAYGTTSTGSLLTPSGLSYTPATGYTGTDVFAVQVSDGIATAVTTVNVTVSLPPVAGVISGATAICGTTTNLLTSTVSGGVWSSANTAVATVDSTGIVTGVGFGTAGISYTVSNACGSAVATATVTYNPTPFAGSVIGAAKVCRGSSLTFLSTVPGGVWSSGNTSIATVSTTGLVYGVDTGIATISYAVTNACGTAYGLRDITVQILPVVAPISGASSICAGASTTFTNTTPYGAWYSSNTSVATVHIDNGVVTGVAAGTAIISYVHNTSCGVVMVTKSITINPVLVVVPAIGGSPVVCAGSTITLTNGLTGGTWSSDSYPVVLSVGSTSGIVTGITSGTATITYTVNHSCGSSYVTRIITVNPMPVVTPITGTMSICSGWSIPASNATPGGVWSSSNTAMATVNTAGIITGVAAGMPVISYSVSNSCGTATATVLVPVGAAPDVAAIGGPSVVCVSGTVALTNATAGGSWITSNISVAAVSSAGIVTGVGAGTAIISYSVHNGCGYSFATRTITVNPLPAVASITGLSAVCVGSDITLSNATTGGTWSSSNTSIASVGSTGIVNGLAAGSVTISYSITNSCGTAVATHNVSVLILSAVIHETHVTTPGGSDGCALLTVVGGVSPYTFLWSNGATTQNISGLAAGTYSVLVTDAIGDTTSAWVTITTLYARNTQPGMGDETVAVAAHGAHPNPFVSQSIIRFNLPVGKYATVDVFNAATGIKVATIFSDYINAGEEYTATIDGTDIPSGMYIYRIATEEKAYLGKVLLVK